MYRIIYSRKIFLPGDDWIYDWGAWQVVPDDCIVGGNSFLTVAGCEDQIGCFKIIYSDLKLKFAIQSPRGFVLVDSKANWPVEGF